MRDEDFIKVKQSEGRDEYEISPTIKRLMKNNNWTYEQAINYLNKKPKFKK